MADDQHQASPDDGDIDADGPLPVIHSHAAYFFVPLPQPLPFVDKQAIPIADMTPAGDYWHAQGDDELEGPPPPVHQGGSLMFHRTTRPSPTIALASELFALARQALPSQPGQDDEPGPVPPSVHDAEGTVVEMAVLFDLDDNDYWGSISDAFDRGLSYIRDVQRAHYLVRREAVRLVTREILPTAIPVAVRWLYDDQGNPAPFEAPLGVLMLNDSIVRETRGPDFDVAAAEALGAALETQTADGVFTGYLEFRREAQVALDHDGAYRAAVLFNATACEILLDELLAHMMWEEGQQPEDAAGTFGGPWLTSRVKQQYHARLGGQWDLARPGPVLDWHRDVAGLRNRVVHSGYEPTLHETHAAFDATKALETHLGDLVAARASRYPRTALALPGVAGLKRRNRFSKALDRLIDDPNEVSWRHTFARWRTAMHRLRPDSPTWTAPSTDRAFVLLVVRKDGTTQWVVHDREADMAARVHPEQVTGMKDGQRDETENVVRWITETPDRDDIGIAYAGASVVPTAELDWLPEYRLVPLAGVLVTGHDLDP